MMNNEFYGLSYPHPIRTSERACLRCPFLSIQYNAFTSPSSAISCEAQGQRYCDISNRYCACAPIDFQFKWMSSFVHNSVNILDRLSPNLKQPEFVCERKRKLYGYACPLKFFEQNGNTLSVLGHARDRFLFLGIRDRRLLNEEY